MLDNMANFFLDNGICRVIAKQNFSDPVFHDTWSMSDKGRIGRENVEFVTHSDEAFFALMLSTSDHASFEWPQDQPPLFEKSSNTVNNVIKCAD